MFWFERSERPKPRARPAGKFRQEFYRKASLVGAVKFGSTAQVGPNFLPKRANCFARAQDLKAGALCEFEYEPREYERRAWRGGAASGEGQRADLWTSSWWAATQENSVNTAHFLVTIMVTISPPQKRAVFYKNSMPKSMKICIILPY